MKRPDRSTEEQLYSKARKKAQAIRGFYINAAAYCIVIPASVYLNYRYTPAFQWWWMAILCWGTGLAIHAMDAFGRYPFLSKEWEKRKMKELLEKEKAKEKNNH